MSAKYTPEEEEQGRIAEEILMSKGKLSCEKMPAKHTPIYITKENGNRWLIIQTPDDRTLCYCDTREKAELIVRAVNNFDQMLATLKLCFEEWPERFTPCYGELKAAIAQAEGKS